MSASRSGSRDAAGRDAAGAARDRDAAGRDAARDRDAAGRDAARDRDAAGRARNARPRDGLGRPLPFSRAGDAVATMPDDLVLDGAGAARLGDELIRAGRPFHAHEVFEASWKSGPAGERELWQGLAQIAVGLTHAHRGNARGAVTLLRRGTSRVRAYRAEVGAGAGAAYGMDLAAVLAAGDDLAGRIERQGLAGIPAADLRPRLLLPNQ